MKNKSSARRPPRPNKIRYAVVGLGYISQVAMLPAFAHARKNSELIALVSEDPEKLSTLSKKYKINRTYSYEQYEQCLNSGEIDAVYVALPNNMHRDYTERAAKAGIHVLCEKPMAVTEKDCQAMIAAAESANVKLMIAYRLHFEIGNLKAIQIIDSPKFGDIRIFNSVFTQQVKEGDIRLKAELGGGPLYDIGIYCINAARYLFKAEPEEVLAISESNKDKRFREVNEMNSVIMRFPGNRLAAFTCSFGAASEASYEVVGTKGVLKVGRSYEMVSPITHELTISDKTTKRTYAKRDQFAPELIYFSDCILKNKTPEPSGLEGLADVKIIEALMESTKSRRWVKTPSIEEHKRPTLAQQIGKPAVREPELVNAAAPGGD
jgi:predicted dehydrogenase